MLKLFVIYQYAQKHNKKYWDDFYKKNSTSYCLTLACPPSLLPLLLLTQLSVLRPAVTSPTWIHPSTPGCPYFHSRVITI